MEEEVEEQTPEETSKFSLKKYSRSGLILFIALSLAVFHYQYVQQLHENDTSFSYLSALEREMCLRTEMGFYYSYYKTVVEEKPFIAAITRIMYDRLVEYPKEVNALNRFNIHPEILIGGAYSYFESWINTTAHRECHTVDRGEGLSPIISCVGIGEPMVFYLKVIFGFAGVNLAAIFLSAVTLSETILGGVVAALQYMTNHANATRVMWAPNERENLAAPLIVLQGCLVTMHLRDARRRTSFPLQMGIFWLNCFCLLFWQFTQFIFLTQIFIFFVMEELRLIDLKTLGIFLHSHFCGLHMAIFLLQGNDMLKTSYYASMFLVLSVYCLVFGHFKLKLVTNCDFLLETWLSLLRICLVVAVSLYVKVVLSEFFDVQDDNHVLDLLISKFSSYKSFHTLIYTCSEVFDFLPFETVKQLTKTLLIPTVFLSVANMFAYYHRRGKKAMKDYVKKKRKHKNASKSLKSDTEDSGIENSSETTTQVKMADNQNGGTDIDKLERKLSPIEYKKDALVVYLASLKVDAAFFYQFAQMCTYAIMAFLVMRLKVLFVPQLCILASMFMNRTYHYKPKSPWIAVTWVAGFASVASSLYSHMSTELSINGEYTNIEQEQLLQWIMEETPATASFAGSMPILASVLLSTRRPVVAHPHYENKEARDRAYAVYKVYGRLSAEEYYQELKKLKAAYLIVEAKYCYGRGRDKHCSFEEIWEHESPGLARRRPLCETLLTRPEGGVPHLYKVFSNSEYAIFQVHDFSVRYMPRSFES